MSSVLAVAGQMRQQIMGRGKPCTTAMYAGPSRGIWEGIFSALAGSDGAPDRVMIDSTIVKAHRTSGGAKGGLWLMVSAVPRADGPPRSTS